MTKQTIKQKILAVVVMAMYFIMKAIFNDDETIIFLIVGALIFISA